MTKKANNYIDQAKAAALAAEGIRDSQQYVEKKFEAIAEELAAKAAVGFRKAWADTGRASYPPVWAQQLPSHTTPTQRKAALAKAYGGSFTVKADPSLPPYAFRLEHSDEAEEKPTEEKLVLERKAAPWK